jgi:hypothetical protein
MDYKSIVLCLGSPQRHRHNHGSSSMAYLADADRFGTLADRMCSRARTSSHLGTRAIEIQRIKLDDVHVLVELEPIRRVARKRVIVTHIYGLNMELTSMKLKSEQAQR